MYQKIIEGPLEKKAGKNFGPPGNKKLIYFVDDLNMAALDPYGTASNISLMRQHMGYGHIYDLNKLSMKVLLSTQPFTSRRCTIPSRECILSACMPLARRAPRVCLAGAAQHTVPRLDEPVRRLVRDQR